MSETFEAVVPFALSIDPEEARAEAIAEWYRCAEQRGATPTGAPTAERCEEEPIDLDVGQYFAQSIALWRVSGPALRAPDYSEEWKP